MEKHMRFLLLPLLLSFCAPAFAASANTRQEAYLTDAPINAACVSDPGHDDTPTCASFVVHTKNHRRVCLKLDYTYDAAGYVQVYKDSSRTGNLPWARLQIGDGASPPTVRMGEHVVEWETAAANDVWEACWTVTGEYTRFRITSTSGTASDTVTAEVTLLDY